MKTCWKKAQTFAFISIFVVVTFAISTGMNQIAPKTGNAFPIFAVIAASILCMSTPRTTWRVIRRITYVAIAWLGVSLLGIGVMFVAYVPLQLLGALHYLDVVGNLLAGTGFVLIAMRQSALFVCQVSQDPIGNPTAASATP